MTGYRVTRRDRFVCWICNWLLNHVATRQYRAFITTISRRGVYGLSRDEQLTVGLMAAGREA